MARYRGPKSKIARKFRQPIFGPDKALEKIELRAIKLRALKLEIEAT